jgi:F420H(2)-dependent quinone reductase
MGLQAIFYSALNVPMRALLRSPLHGLASRNLCILSYAGRKSGRRFDTPLSYVREGSTIWLLTSRDTRWWTNFLPGAGAGAPVEVLAGGRSLRGRARTIQHEPARLRESVRRFLIALPRDAVVYKIGLDRERRPVEADLEKALARLVMVEVTLEG